LPSTPIYENRPQVIMEQWRDQPLLWDTVAAPVQNTWYPVYDAARPTGVISDVQVATLALRHISGAARDMAFRAVVDGTWYTGVVLAAPDTIWHYFYLNPAANNLIPDVNIRLAQYSTTWNGESAFFEMRHTDAGVVNSITGCVRYQQL